MILALQFFQSYFFDVILLIRKLFLQSYMLDKQPVFHNIYSQQSNLQRLELFGKVKQNRYITYSKFRMYRHLEPV